MIGGGGRRSPSADRSHGSVPDGGYSLRPRSRRLSPLCVGSLRSAAVDSLDVNVREAAAVAMEEAPNASLGDARCSSDHIAVHAMEAGVGLSDDAAVVMEDAAAAVMEGAQVTVAQVTVGILGSAPGVAAGCGRGDVAFRLPDVKPVSHPRLPGGGSVSLPLSTSGDVVTAMDSAGCGKDDGSGFRASDIMHASSSSLHGGVAAVDMGVTPGLAQPLFSPHVAVPSHLISANASHVSAVIDSSIPSSAHISGSVSSLLSPPVGDSVFKFQNSVLDPPGCTSKNGSHFSFAAQKVSTIPASSRGVDTPVESSHGAAVQAPNPWRPPVLFRLPAKEPHASEVVRGDRVQLDVADVVATSKRFESALVGRLFGRHFSFATLNAELHRRWAAFGGFKLVTVSGDCFLCFFDSVQGCEAVLFGGPWVIAGQVVGVDRWSPDFSPKSKAGFVTPVWVRFPSLPMYCWGARNLVRIAGLLGEPVYMDAATEKLDRSHYARVCIRMDLSMPLRAGMWIDGPHGSFYQSVEFEGLPRCCFKCGLVGHRSEWCTVSVPSKATVAARSAVHSVPPLQVKETSMLVDTVLPPSDANVDHGSVAAALSSGQVSVPTTACGDDVKDGLGPWMLVSRRRQKPRAWVASGPPQGSVDKPRRWSGTQPAQVAQWLPVAPRQGRVGSSGSQRLGAAVAFRKTPPPPPRSGKVVVPVQGTVDITPLNAHPLLESHSRTHGQVRARSDSEHCVGQSSGGSSHLLHSDPPPPSSLNTISGTLLLTMGDNADSDCGFSSPPVALGKKRRLGIINDGGDASPLGLA